MQVKVFQNAPKEHSAIFSTFIKLPFVFKTFVLSIFEWLLNNKTDFTVYPPKFTKLWHYIFFAVSQLTFSLIFVRVINGSAVVKCSTVKPV